MRAMISARVHRWRSIVVSFPRFNTRIAKFVGCDRHPVARTLGEPGWAAPTARAPVHAGRPAGGGPERDAGGDSDDAS